MEKGFTLFTALVAVMIIFLGILITQTMISGERGATEIIRDIEEEAEMLDFANFRRTDALQQFNFRLRFAFAKYFSKDYDSDGAPENEFVIRDSDLDPALSREEQWEQLQAEFIDQYFGDIGSPTCNIPDPLDTSTPIPVGCKARQIVQFTADEITNSLRLDNSPDAAYSAEIEEIDELQFKKILLFVFGRSAKIGEFLEVSDCDGDYIGGGCPGGGFYINLDFSEEELGPPTTGIPNEVYEALPQIKVTKKGSPKVLKQPIFPRSTMRVFVPARIFKAIAGAHQAIIKNNKLIFDDASDFKSTLKEIKLGVCDTKKDVGRDHLPGPLVYCLTEDWHTCHPRISFEDVENSLWGFNKACIGHQGLPGFQKLTNVNLSGGLSYNPNDPDTARDAIKEYVEDQRLQDLLDSFSSVGDVEGKNDPAEFELVRKSATQVLWDPKVDARAFDSRRVLFGGSQVGDSTSTCSKITKLQGIFVFQENNEKYIVDIEPANPAFETRFAIRIIDNGFDEYGPLFDERETVEDCTSILDAGNYACPNPQQSLVWLEPC